MPTVRSVASWGSNEPGPEAWSEVSFIAGDDLAPAAGLDELLAAFRGAVREVCSASFRISGLDDRLREWLSADHGNQLPFVTRLLDSAALRQALPDLRRTLVPGVAGEWGELDFEWVHPLFFAPSLALQLSTESAYGSGPDTVTAKGLADSYVENLIGARYGDFHLADSNAAWSDWFFEVIPTWDRTWLITDLSRGQSTLLCVTDTD